ncbi:MAG: Asp-tRNA(Asn)/Glu-tRNA(Gln) amidotransferase subunit GatB [Candidatus Peregrinibacteria bacterium]
MMEYEPVIGLEVHARIKSKTKLFCRCSNDFFNAAPNSHVCPICMGFPGMLPLPNGEAIQQGIKAAVALGCAIPEFSKFDRKSYFYPDLPKGYQISQYDKPVSEKGKITIRLADGILKPIGITRLHLEDDAGKLTHTEKGTLVDYNRSGSPLMEIVSEPELFSVEEASAYTRQIQKILRYVEASDADMEKGQMRFDINISLRPKGVKKFGVKVEVKNLNSFRSLEKALAYEIQRQTELLSGGKTIIQETRGWDDEKEVTASQRSKEGSADYRYFPEPDIPPLVVTREMIAELKKQIPELPEAKAERYQQELKLPVAMAQQLAASADLALYFERAFKISGDAQKTANWILSELMAKLNENGIAISDCPLSPEHLGKLVALICQSRITGKIAKGIFPELYEKNLNPETLVAEKGFEMMCNTAELEKICREVIAKNPQTAADFKAGKERALGALIGQVMAATHGTAAPESVNNLLKKLIFNS